MAVVLQTISSNDNPQDTQEPAFVASHLPDKSAELVRPSHAQWASLFRACGIGENAASCVRQETARALSLTHTQTTAYTSGDKISSAACVYSHVSSSI